MRFIFTLLFVGNKCYIIIRLFKLFYKLSTSLLYSSMIDEIINDKNLSLILKKQQLKDEIDKLINSNDITTIESTITSLQQQQQQSNYSDLLNSLLFKLSDLYLSNDEYTSSANQLVKLNFDLLNHNDLLNIYIKILRLYLEDDDYITSEIYLNRSASLLHQTTDKSIILAYKLSQARILDFKREFERSSLNFQELSFDKDLDIDERLNSLSSAIITAILAPAGPQRSRILNTLYRDERSKSLETFSILEKVFFDRILFKNDITSFEQNLSSHQLAKINEPPLDDQGRRQGPSNVLERAMIEHNILAASKIYSNITIDGLANLLDLSPSAAESFTSKMILQSRLDAYIDQVLNAIIFNPSLGDPANDLGGAAAVAAAQEDERQAETAHAPMTQLWDDHIRNVSTLVSKNEHKIVHTD